MITIVVYGIPGPQGSKSFKGHTKTGRGILVESSKKVKPWREAVRWAYLDAVSMRYPGFFPMFVTPVRVEMTFTFAKPKRPKYACHGTRPDLSKLARSTEDALSDIGCWADDSLVTQYDKLAKRYPNEGDDALDRPGCVIRIRSISE